ncbi:SnoaL-like protein [Hyphomicrobiales bacterium]|nr:SnoaL-like protein [Hyphomicrobiales bacterium]CAH1694759.1 SnoaL-like protein [Hyphomicrobiales bacterium]
MDFQAQMRARQELEALLMEYWHDVDTNWGRNAGEYYTDDAVFESTYASYHGKAKIKQFYQYRLDRGPRVAVHAVTNFRVALESPTRATCNWYLLLFAADGKPILPTNPPIQIAHMTDICVKQPDGRWLYAHRKFDAWFEGGVPTTNPNLDDK